MRNDKKGNLMGNEEGEEWKWFWGNIKVGNLESKKNYIKIWDENL